MTSRTTKSRTKTKRSRALAVTTATLLAFGGGTATIATSGAQEDPSEVSTQQPPSEDVQLPERNADEAAQYAADIVTDIEQSPWTDVGAMKRDYDPNQSLSAITLDVEEAHGGTPRQTALFAGSHYIGTTTPEAYPFQTTERVSDNVIKVNYRWLQPGDVQTEPSGSATSYYTLHPHGIERTGTLPPEGVGVPPVA
ncbi:MAG TPA: LppP/LprE family lipoprotein [Candidatus Corynebacterium avicola]|uniref:LppP/LprE family lipoprotein n=1 Tax=Candidatus Corynebacterium avicola TaxID=2838527 RepID=A0A9D1RPC2_9CORY|nr:LppP/LprE family lipoprotein [Candidatus Corynebacterium avicola]